MIKAWISLLCNCMVLRIHKYNEFFNLQTWPWRHRQTFIYSLLTKSFAWYLHVQLCLKPSSNSKQFSCHKPIQYLSNDIIEKKNWQKMICIIYLIALESCGKVHFQIKRSWENSPLTLYCPPFHTMWRGRGRILALFPTYGDFHWTWKDTIKVQNSKEFKV